MRLREVDVILPISIDVRCEIYSQRAMTWGIKRKITGFCWKEAFSEFLVSRYEMKITRGETIQSSCISSAGLESNCLFKSCGEIECRFGSYMLTVRGLQA